MFKKHKIDEDAVVLLLFMKLFQTREGKGRLPLLQVGRIFSSRVQPAASQVVRNNRKLGQVRENDKIKKR